MKKPLDDAALDTLFRKARSYNRWTSDPVPETQLRALYDLLKMGPDLGQLLPGTLRLRREPRGQGEARRMCLRGQRRSRCSKRR